MEDFQRLGFDPVPDDVKKKLKKLNPSLKPRLHRYQGMGHYDLLVEHKRGFLLMDMGGENWLTQEQNDKVYAAIDSKCCFRKLKDLFPGIAGQSWLKIVKEEQFDGGRCQHIEVITPQQQ